MNVELICVGSELTSGDVVNTNASFISKRLRELGHNSFRQFTVDDNKFRLSELIEQSLKRSDLIIVTGGLGPTADDITKETVCEALNIPLTENVQCKKHIDNYFKNLGSTPTKNNYKQALAPEGAIIFPNEKGTACGIGIEEGGKRIIMLPGPPRELSHIFDTHVVPYLKRLNHHAIVTHSLNVFGLGESVIETKIKELCNKQNPVVATYCGNNECEVKITATAASEAEAEAICSRTMIKIKELIGDYVYGADSNGLATEVVNALRTAHFKISTAESCTGGMLSESLTSVPHSSEVVELGILAYSNRIKQEALSVPRDVLADSGAISAETAMYLAKNVRILSDSDIGVGITGNAGPSASENKPIGLVYVAIADKTKYLIKKLQLPETYDRERIRSYATLTALDLVRRYLAARPLALEGMVSYDAEFEFEEDQTTAEVAVENSADNNIPSPFEPNMNFIVFEPDDEDIKGTVFPAQDTADIKAEQTSANFAEKDNLEEKVGVLTRLKESVSGVFPKKNDTTKDLIIKIVAIIALVGLVVSSSVLITRFASDSAQRNIIENARDEFDFNNEKVNLETSQYSAFDNLIKQNPDIKGWISIPNTNIDNPIYQSNDNDYYLNHNMLKKKSRYGALFFDYTNNISTNGNSKNLTVYGHNTKDKSMFGTLRNYRSLSFYKTNPVIKLKTLYEQSDYVIFATLITNAVPEDDNGYLYNFTRSQFASDEDFMSWVAEAKERSYISTGVQVDADDEILTLSTCCYDFDNARLVVMAKKVAGDGDTLPDVSSAALNKNTRYPQAWYDKKGLDGYHKIESKPSNSSPASSNSNSSPTSSNNSSSTDDNDASDEQTSSSSSNQTSSDNSSSAGAIPTVCTHTYSKQPTANGNQHKYTCTKCGTDKAEAHSFTLEQVDNKYLSSKASCSKAAEYFKSCKCGATGTETFISGTALEHSPAAEWSTDATGHWKACTNEGCNEKLDAAAHSTQGSCECGYQPSGSNDQDTVE